MKFDLIAPCYFGTESTAAFEVRRLGAENVQVTDGRIAFSGDESMIAAANLGRMLGQDSEQALSRATTRFQNRVISCEEQAAAEGKALEEVSPAALDRYWKAAKETEQTSKG